MAKKKAKPKAEPVPSFEEALDELETIVAELEGGELGLDDALGRYEQGVARLKQCHEQLARAERKIELLSGVDAEGNPIAEPLDPEDSASLDDKAASRSQRRSRKSAGGSGRSDVDDRGGLF